jgi:lipid A 3-O-deacylase
MKNEKIKMRKSCTSFFIYYSSFVIFYFLLGIGITGAAYGQQPASYQHLLRAYEDNDIINIRGLGTDQGYSNGSRFDYFFIKDKPSRFFLHRMMPKAGDSSIDTYGVSVMQVIFTPKNIIKRIPDKNDFPYAGAIFATHSLHSTNQIQKYNWQTEWLLGVMGPPSLGEETQRLAHKTFGLIEPGGWDYQLKTDLLLNLSVAAEKQFAHINNTVEFIGGAQAFAGTALNGASVYSLIRIGKMTPYFSGYLSQFTMPKGKQRRTQLYGIIRPSVEWVLSNALIDGGVFNKGRQPVPERDPDNDEPEMGNMERKRLIGKLDYGIVFSLGWVCVSFTQTTMTPMVKGTDMQEVGNISLFIAW